MIGLKYNEMGLSMGIHGLMGGQSGAKGLLRYQNQCIKGQ